MSAARHLRIDEGAADGFARLVRDARACAACERVAHAHVLGAANGPLDARVMFVAEAPGRRGAAVTGVPLTRDETGRRFEMLMSLAGLDRRDVFITNAVLCNPLDGAGRNRPPSRAEVTRCRPFLERTLAVVPALYVVALGRVALEALRAVAPHQLDLRRDVAAPAPWSGRILVPMYHPGHQSTLHRPHELQAGDWNRLGALLRSGTPAALLSRAPASRYPEPA